ncbi:membrane hypothetical protein [Nitrospina gracilis 3/211]|uniref:Uncharacterized protein n=1 Tax=Nitrospina gracilis (strain 3/211) TaxID=1266370 RepID=M1YVT3_NITG3|nr:MULTISPECIES: hypothetical protein [Nitrospina]MCF8722769.1 hypothetical protein [Nitrospina sp. Nb-3]CCQ89719.1 membrane hypothetical protein [Nitrospina gracilis 3/211]
MVTAREIAHVLNPVLCLAINVLIQIAVARWGRWGLLKSVYLGFAAGMGALLGGEWVIAQGSGLALNEAAALLFVNVVTYGMLGYCYFHFINLGETARRIRLLRELHEAGGGLALDELLGRYNASQMVEIRLKRLLGTGQIVERDGRYFIGKPVMLWISQAIVVAKRIVLGKSSEFD